MIFTGQNFRGQTAACLATLAICILLLNAGCTSHSAYVVARQNAQYQLGTTNKIAIADHAQPRDEETALRAALMLELRQQGFLLVAPGEAEYTLTYWIDQSWKRGKIVVSDHEGTWRLPDREPGFPYAPNVAPFFGPSGAYQERSLGIQHVAEVPYETKGIRLKLFHQESMRVGRMQTAWDGYIEGGDEVSEKREPVLVRTLLNYFGKDFVGRAKLITTPPSSARR